MKYKLFGAMLLASSGVFADTALSPTQIVTAHFMNSMQRMPIVSEIRSAKTEDEKALAQAKLDAIFLFDRTYVDQDRVKRNGSQANSVRIFSGRAKTWAKSKGIELDSLMVRSKIIEESDGVASVDLLVEQAKCSLELYKQDSNWKIVKENCR
jgi:hypothetical protein